MKFQKKVKKKLSSEFLKDIIESENLLISDEDSLLDFLIDIVFHNIYIFKRFKKL